MGVEELDTLGDGEATERRGELDSELCRHYACMYVFLHFFTVTASFHEQSGRTNISSQLCSWRGKFLKPFLLTSSRRSKYCFTTVGLKAAAGYALTYRAS